MKVYVLIFNDIVDESVDVDLYKDFESVKQAFDRILRTIRSCHTDDPEWVVELEYMPEHESLYLRTKEDYEVFTRIKHIATEG